MLRTLFGTGPKTDLKEVLAKGAVILDVRTKAEYAEGHVKGSLNIPLDQVEEQLKKLDRTRPVITCCKSGARSGMATDILKRAGVEAYNGGSWQSVHRLMAQ